LLRKNKATSAEDEKALVAEMPNGETTNHLDFGMRRSEPTSYYYIRNLIEDFLQEKRK